MKNKEKIHLMKQEEMKLYNEIQNLTHQIKTEPTCCVCDRYT